MSADYNFVRQVILRAEELGVFEGHDRELLELRSALVLAFDFLTQDERVSVVRQLLEKDVERAVRKAEFERQADADNDDDPIPF